MVKVATRQKQGSGGIADSKFRSGKDPQLVHDSCRIQIVCMDETEKGENGSCQQPSSSGKEAPIEYASEYRRPNHRDQKRPLAERNHSIDREFLPKLRRGLEQTRSSCP